MLIAIKGLIGSGKTTTSEYLHEKYNAYHYNCDKRVKAIYKTHADVIREVNEKVLETSADSIDMLKLREVAFGDVKKLLMLESIIYPYIEAEIDSVNEAYDFVILDCQQIDKMELDIDHTICLMLDEELIIDRVKLRDGRTRDEIENILEIQKEYEITSDYIAKNNGAITDLQMQLDAIMEEINENAGR
ncbi:dephospho-CoA kinase [Mollicutes bacterium LVI A0039]|nr:dephospho-CoA kinase [Mollicutes bacterium LVI A0039]